MNVEDDIGLECATIQLAQSSEDVQRSQHRVAFVVHVPQKML